MALFVAFALGGVLCLVSGFLIIYLLYSWIPKWISSARNKYEQRQQDEANDWVRYHKRLCDWLKEGCWNEFEGSRSLEAYVEFYTSLVKLQSYFLNSQDYHVRLWGIALREVYKHLDLCLKLIQKENTQRVLHPDLAGMAVFFRDQVRSKVELTNIDVDNLTKLFLSIFEYYSQVNQQIGENEETLIKMIQKSGEPSLSILKAAHVIQFPK
jgi:hypothetical protein